MEKVFTIFTGKHLRWSIFVIKLQALRAAILLQNRLQHSCFPVNIVKFLGTPILNKICEWLLLKMFFKKAVLKNFGIFTGKQLCWSLFLIKLQIFRAATLLKRDPNIIFFS